MKGLHDGTYAKGILVIHRSHNSQPLRLIISELRHPPPPPKPPTIATTIFTRDHTITTSPTNAQPSTTVNRLHLVSLPPRVTGTGIFNRSIPLSPSPEVPFFAAKQYPAHSSPPILQPQLRLDMTSLGCSSRSTRSNSSAKGLRNPWTLGMTRRKPASSGLLPTLGRWTSAGWNSVFGTQRTGILGMWDSMVGGTKESNFQAFCRALRNTGSGISNGVSSAVKALMQPTQPTQPSYTSSAGSHTLPPTALPLSMTHHGPGAPIGYRAAAPPQYSIPNTGALGPSRHGIPQFYPQRAV